MMDLLSGTDPVAGVGIDTATLRAKVDERIGRSVPVAQLRPPTRRPWLKAAVAFAVALLVFVPVWLLTRSDEQPALRLFDLTGNLTGVTATIDLGGGGVKTMAVDGDTIWVMSALQRRLSRVDAPSARVGSIYPIDDYVEGVTVGGGYVWLMGYDDGGELLRFDPSTGRVDRTTPLGSFVTGVKWFGDRLWVGTEDGVLRVITTDGVVESEGPGELKGTGLGYLWVGDPGTGAIGSVGEDGRQGEITIPVDAVAGTGPIRSVSEAGGFLWLLEGDFPNGSSVWRFDLATGEYLEVKVTVGVFGMVEFDGSLWVTSSTDHLLARVDPDTGSVEMFALPGKPGGAVAADGSLWVALYQPGALVRLDSSDLVPAGVRTVDAVSNQHRLVCTAGAAGADGSTPTVLLDAAGWIDYGSLAMVQAELAGTGVASCAHGYLNRYQDGVRAPAERAGDLERSLREAGVEGPYLLVAIMDGVHSTRLFAAGRSDVVGMVLVDPMPVGFPAFYDEAVPALAGHPPWADLDAATAPGHLGGIPLVVIGQDPQRVFLSSAFRRAAGQDLARMVNDFWQEGLVGYAALSSDSTMVTAFGAGLDTIVWEQPDLIVGEVVALLGRLAPG